MNLRTVIFIQIHIPTVKFIFQHRWVKKLTFLELILNIDFHRDINVRKYDSFFLRLLELFYQVYVPMYHTTYINHIVRLCFDQKIAIVRYVTFQFFTAGQWSGIVYQAH